MHSNVWANATSENEKRKGNSTISSSSPHQKISQPNITFIVILGAFLEDGGGFCVHPHASGSFGRPREKVADELPYFLLFLRVTLAATGWPGGVPSAHQAHPGLTAALVMAISLSKAEARFSGPSSSATWRATSQVSNSAVIRALSVNSGLFEFVLVSASVSADKRAIWDPPSLHRKIPFPTRMSETGSNDGWFNEVL